MSNKYRPNRIAGRDYYLAITDYVHRQMKANGTPINYYVVRQVVRDYFKQFELFVKEFPHKEIHCQEDYEKLKYKGFNFFQFATFRFRYKKVNKKDYDKD